MPRCPVQTPLPISSSTLLIKLQHLWWEFGQQIFVSEVDNNLGASFVILGLVASVSYVDQHIWLTFTQQTLFLRPHVRSLAYCLRVLADQRAAFEQKYNSTISVTLNGTSQTRGYAAEYAPVILQSANISSYMNDLSGYPILDSAIVLARDTGNFSLSAPYKQEQYWRMGSFIPYYGSEDPDNLTTVEARRADCLGYVVTVLNVEEVFGSVINRCF